MGPVVARLVELSDVDRRAFVTKELTPDQIFALVYDWREWGRPNQQPPEGEEAYNGLWDWWIILAGRGWGKTRTGSEWVHSLVRKHWKTPIQIAAIAETKKDARDVIAKGPAGILATAPPWAKPTYLKSEGLFTWANGTTLNLYSGEEPDQLRGPAFHYAWVDEWAKYQYPVEMMDNLELALRMGDHPQGIITTTPRPLPMLKEMMVQANVVITRGHTNENRANLAPSYIRRVIAKYEGTRLGRQELAGEILDDVEGGFWTRALLDKNRAKYDIKKGRFIVPEMIRIAIALDPATTSGAEANETGIIVGGKGTDGKLYVFHDLSGQYTPEQWGLKAIRNYDHMQADAMVGERNNGGDLIERNIRTLEDHRDRKGHAGERIAFRTVWASRGKHVRAEPVASLHEQGKIIFVGQFPQLEDQLIFYTPEGYEGVGSPDRGDAFVWLAWFLMLGAKGGDYDSDEWADSSR